MTIVKHKNINMTVDEILNAVISHNIPHGVVIDICDGTITVSPEGETNLFGLIGPDYEAIFYQEEVY